MKGLVVIMQAIRADIYELPKGTIIQGQANKGRYAIENRLSKKVTGTVYLCRHRGKKYTLKLNKRASLLTREINALTTLGRVRNQRIVPRLVDVDEWLLNGSNSYAFYVTEYIKGETVERFIKKRERNWLPLFVVKLLQQLEKIHSAGYIYGNFTMEDVVITEDLQICLTHLGHVTKIGHPVIVQSKYFDRSFWTLGSRIATPDYDLFVIIMIILQVYYRQQIPFTKEPTDQLVRKITQLPIAKPYKQCFLKAILGKYNEASEMKQEFLQAIVIVEDYPLFSKENAIKRERPSLGEINGLFLLSLAYFLGGYFLG